MRKFPSICQLLLGAAENLNLDMRELQRKSGVTYSIIEASDNPPPLFTLRILKSISLQMVSNNYPLLISSAITPDLLGPIFLIFFSSKNFQESICNLNRVLFEPRDLYLKIINNKDGSSSIVLMNNDKTTEYMSDTIELIIMSVLVRLVRWGRGRYFRWKKLKLSRKAPIIGLDYSLGILCQFGCEQSSLDFASSELSQEMLTGSFAPSVNFHREIDAYLETELNIVRPIKALVDTNLQNQEFCLENAAEYLGVNIRTLQRRLKAHGVTFKEIALSVRMDMALKLLLERSCTTENIAQHLGYHEVNSFIRAFKKRFAISPSEFREGLHYL
ncbi:helix-turn-helix transcriptional regulator [Sansalvadorimonas sp. 2012CJ34-2]|uniref:Helix-turn-helix transcriptional regulator n=1 Tax=Parendozoicomonas callyspongiae TaxID=2942213 RepID=A0ABT0PKP8_9GAMM|nr:helix-turn-helix transcriptional regulator [Sansalvadorimonas sp. 2012CJ34-2]MCL6271297.1 helix-turn-helix transcriptional regulator [Sansalvadorimonas sp. 2012CJ34-2]